jgi:hypothetical protein
MNRAHVALMGDIGVDGRIILKWILKKYVLRV